MSFVINLAPNQDGKKCFTYSTRQIEDLLRTARKMIEAYTCYIIKVPRRLDDAVSSFEIDGEEIDVKASSVASLQNGS